MTEKEIKAIDCMLRHLQTFFDQSGERRGANFAEPCSLCERREECECDWLGTMQPIIRQSNVGFTAQSPAQRRKWGSHHHSLQQMKCDIKAIWICIASFAMAAAVHAIRMLIEML